jgi:hypothetical protein
MSVITQKEKVYGMLLTQFGDFELLAPEPEKKNLPFYLRDGALSFYILREGYARHIIVKGDFGLVPYVNPQSVEVKFEVEDEGETLRLETSTVIPTSV